MRSYLGVPSLSAGVKGSRREGGGPRDRTHLPPARFRPGYSSDSPRRRNSRPRRRLLRRRLWAIRGSGDRRRQRRPRERQRAAAPPASGHPLLPVHRVLQDGPPRAVRAQSARVRRARARQEGPGQRAVGGCGRGRGPASRMLLLGANANPFHPTPPCPALHPPLSPLPSCDHSPARAARCPARSTCSLHRPRTAEIEQPAPLNPASVSASVSVSRIWTPSCPPCPPRARCRSSSETAVWPTRHALPKEISISTLNTKFSVN